MSEINALQAQESTAVLADQIQDTVVHVENLEKEEAFALARDLIESSECNNFQLGGLLTKINGEPEWSDGYPSFNEMLATEFPTLKRRKALYLMAIYTNLVNAEVSWAQVGHLGWTKLKELSSILTKENVAEWVKKAESMTLVQLIEAIRAAKSSGQEGVPTTEDGEEKLTTVTFKVYPDQKETIRDAVTKAKVEAGTEFDNVAIDSICLSYLTGTAPAENQKSLKDQVQEIGYAAALTIISEMYPEVDIKVSVTKPV